MPDAESPNAAAPASLDLTATHVPLESTQDAPREEAKPMTPGELPDVPAFPLSVEIARGGMGVVYAAHDPVLDREVAVKVMHSGQDAGRFVVESKVTARLPHPGIPPVHALGELPDGRPFLAMKLIRGRTLADELSAVDRRAELPRLLGIFEQICHTVGFAHSAGIVHRDLKPANVMVGRFGEVQVMDWGMAKQLGSSPDYTFVVTHAPADVDPHPVTDDSARRTVTFARQDTQADDNTVASPAGSGTAEALLTQQGTVMGTPAYMAPEQARGEAVDARADVFALGGILATMLTGKPPFSGDSVLDTVTKAAAADLDATLARLDACGADGELVGIAKRCLAAAADDRFDNGEQVATAIAEHRARAEERLRQAERDRAVSEAEVREQRKRRKVQLALAAAVVLIVAGSGGFAWWQETQSADRRETEARLEGERDTEQRFKAEQARQGVKANLALAADLRRQLRFREAGTALEQAGTLAESGAPELASQIKRAQNDLAFAEELDDIRYRKWVLIPIGDRKYTENTGIAPPEYHKAFSSRGMNLKSVKVTEAATRIGSSPAKDELIAAIDDWALYEPDPNVRARLLEIARRVDPDPWRDRLRDPAIWKDKSAVARLANDVDPAATSPASLSMLAQIMQNLDLDASSLFNKARSEYPSDFNLAFANGYWLAKARGNYESAVGAFEAARALRPANAAAWGTLGSGLIQRGDLAGAIVATRKAIRLDPSFTPFHFNLGSALFHKGDVDEAVAAFQAGVAADPKFAEMHNALGAAIERKRGATAAIPHYREALRLDPKNARAHVNLGTILVADNKLKEAEEHFREAIQLAPRFALAHYNLGNVLSRNGDRDAAIREFREAVRLDPNYSSAYFNLGNELKGKRDFDGAVEAYRNAIKANPREFKAHSNLMALLIGRRDAAGALAASKDAIKLTPKTDAERVILGAVFYSRGIAFKAKGDFASAKTAYEEAIRLNPKHAQAHINLGNMLIFTDYEGAIKQFRAAIKHAPKMSQPHFSLGVVLTMKQDFDGAIKHFHMGIKLEPNFKGGYVDLSKVYIRKKDTQGAIETLEAAMKVNPRWYDLQFNLGTLYFRQQKYDKAIEAAQAAIKVNPRFSMAYAMMGDAMLKTGDVAGARKAIHEAARLDPRWTSMLKKLPPANPARKPVPAIRP